MTCAAIYTRLSHSREGETSTQRQEADARTWAERHGITVTAVHSDVGISAFKSLDRPGFDAALKSLLDGDVDVLIVWKLDRLSRRGIGTIGAILDQLEATGRRIVSVMDGVDTAQPQGRLLIAMLSELARAESENIRTRVTSAKRLQVKQGKWLGGRSPFGYLRVVATPGKDLKVRIDPAGPVGKLVQDPESAPILRQIVDRVMSGEPIRRVVAWLNEEGVRGPQGGSWRVSTLSQLLRSPVMAGWLPDARKAPRRDENGEPISVTDEPILSTSEYRALVAEIDKRTVITSSGRKGGRRSTTYLLTGFLRCSLCGSAMSPTGTPYGGVYRCGKSYTSGRSACPGVHVSARPVDDLIATASLERLASLQPGDPTLDNVADRWVAVMAPEVVAERTDLALEIDELKARLDDLEEARYVRGEFSGASAIARFDKLRAQILERLEAAERRLGSQEVPTPDIGALLDLELSRPAWEEATLEDRRAVLSLVLAHADVFPVGHSKGRAFDPDRLKIVWL